MNACLYSISMIPRFPFRAHGKNSIYHGQAYKQARAILCYKPHLGDTLNTSFHFQYVPDTRNIRVSFHKLKTLQQQVVPP